MNINNAFPSKWLKSGDVPEDADLVLTITTVDVETVGQGEDAQEKPVAYFAETDKGLVLNKTNAGTIATLHGPETDGWAGKKISLFATEVQFGSQMTLALRVRVKAPKNVATNGKSQSKLWKRWYELVQEAEAADVDAPTLDEAATDADVLAAGKELKGQIAQAKELAAAGL